MVIAPKYYANADIKVFWFCLVLLDFDVLFLILFSRIVFEALPGLSTAKIFSLSIKHNSLSASSPSKSFERCCFLFMIIVKWIIWYMRFFKLAQTLEQRLKSFLAVLILHLIVYLAKWGLPTYLFSWNSSYLLGNALREKCLNTEFFLVRISLYFGHFSCIDVFPNLKLTACYFL